MAGGPAPVELTTDCTTCQLESGVVETYDALVAACRFGVPAASRCKLCGIMHAGTFDRPPAKPMREIPANQCPACLTVLSASAVDDRRCSACGATASETVRVEALVPMTATELAQALDAWAVREGFPGRQSLLAATLADPDEGRLLDRLLKHERIDVVADPFGNMGIRGASSPRPSADSSGAPKAASRPADLTKTAPLSSPQSASPSTKPWDGKRTDPDPMMPFVVGETDPLAKPIRLPEPVIMHAPSSEGPGEPAPRSSSGSPPKSAPPRAIVWPLVSVIAADGEIHPAERELIDRFLQNEGLPPLADEEFRVHHPSEVAHLVPKDRREAVIQLMCETAAVDGMPDESERRVIRAYASAWDVPDEKVDFWMWGYESMSTSLGRQLWLKLRRFVLSARWSDAEEKK
jgi:uncharacterized tellurite resistance protein B-like protein